MERPLSARFYKTLNVEQKEEFSFVVDEIERATYFETRSDILTSLKRAQTSGKRPGLVEYLNYLINKPKPFIKDR